MDPPWRSSYRCARSLIFAEEELDIVPKGRATGEAEEVVIIPTEEAEELVIIPTAEAEELVIVSVGPEEELIVVTTGEEELIIVSEVVDSSSSASVDPPATLAAQSLSYWAIFSLILVPGTQCVSRSSLRSVTTRPLTWKEPVILPP